MHVQMGVCYSTGRGGKGYVDLEVCPKCGLARYKDVGQAKVLNKVFRHFPLILQLKQMFRALVTYDLMLWHSGNMSINGLVWHVGDNKAWVHIDALWLEFVEEPHNVKLGLTIDGVNPFGERNSSWSTWPILLFNYNLPPWLVTKKLFVMLVLIIPSKEFVKMHNIDVYMVLLIEELQVLWMGVVAYDVLRVERKRCAF